MRARLLLTALIAAVGIVVLAQPSAAGGGADGVPRFGHVFVIIGENTDYQHLTATNAPYLMTTIRRSTSRTSRTPSASRTSSPPGRRTTEWRRSTQPWRAATSPTSASSSRTGATTARRTASR